MAGPVVGRRPPAPPCSAALRMAGPGGGEEGILIVVKGEK